jgi:hypothetical protein
MSAHEQSARTDVAQDDFESVADEPANSSSATETYYAVLAERLEKLIFDMQQHGTAPNDPLILRLADLLSETRGLLQKGKSA